MSSRRIVQHSRRARMAAMVCGACALTLALAPASWARLSPTTFRTQRLCEVHRPGYASCSGIRLLSRSLTSSALHAAAVRQASEVSERAEVAVVNKSPLGGLTPQSLHAAYVLPSETLAGSTQTIAVVDAYNDPTAEADLAVYDSTFGLPACTSANGCFKKLDQQGKTSPLPATNGEWSTEISLDVQMAHAICQNCKVLLVEGNNESYESLGDAVNAAVKAGATEISNSYEGIEESDDATLVADYYNHPGVVITASSGDCGYRDEACGGAASNFPTGSPDVVAVGGTYLSDSEGKWTSTVWEDAGSDCSAIFTAPSWQSGLSSFSATGCAGKRASSDVSADADPYSGVDVYDTTPSEHGYPTGWGIWGGTSESSPIVASEFGLAGGAHGVSYPAATLYSNLGNAKALTDVVSGNNGKCSGASICTAATGYDGPTGVGSPLGLDAFFPGTAPQSKSLPAISGTAEAGQALTASRGEWSGEPSSESDQWELCSASGASCTAISGATKQSFTLAPGDIGSTVRVQESARDGAGAGAPAVSAASATIASNLPTIASFTPTSGITGSTVTITGTHFTSASKVQFGSLNASFKVVSATEIEAVVPNGEDSSTITVTTPAKTIASSSSFKATLSITSFAPQVAFAGKPVTVTGVGFTKTSSISFGGHAVATTFVSSTSLKATVPAEAKAGPISVTNSSAPVGTVTGAGEFKLA
jgi:IPT/TIG domain